MGEQFQKFKTKFGTIKSVIDGTALAPNFDLKKSQFKDFYGTNYPTLRAAEKTLRNLFELLLANESIETPKVLSRIKD